MKTDPQPASPPWLATLIAGCAFSYFLIFAQFGFLHRLEELESDGGQIELVMLAMGLAGIASSIRTARRFRLQGARERASIDFVGCGLAAAISIIASSIWIQVVVASAVGWFLGSLTVSIVPMLRSMVKAGRIGRCAALSVGGAYFVCNIPIVFNLSPEDHCLSGAVICCVGVVAALKIGRLDEMRLRREAAGDRTEKGLFQTKGVWLVALLFLGLIWLDSAAFYVIQKTDSLKSASWQSDSQLWGIASIHLLMAIAAGWALDRGWVFSILLGALLLLELGAYFLQIGVGYGTMATLLYITGVSLYSTALVAYGSLAPEEKGLWKISSRAGIVFALGGWFGSAMGIGMARDLQRIPTGFLAIALAVALSCLAIRPWITISVSREATG